MKRFLFLIFVLIGIFGFWFSNFNWLWQEIVVNQLAKISTLGIEKQENIPEIKIFAVGDIMLDRGVEYMIKKHGAGDWRFPFLKIADYLQTGDILFGNLESIISDKGQRVGSIYSFRADPESIEALKYAGFDILSVANNHVFDYGRMGMEHSFNQLKQAGIDYVGAGFSENEACSPIIKTIKITHDRELSSQIKIAFLAYNNKGSKYWEATETRSGICFLLDFDTIQDRPRDTILDRQIQKAKKEADVVIVSMHWGEEYESEPNQEQKYFGYLAINAGADLVIGHHPHVIQQIEKYKNGWIAYSLGNFVFDQGFSEQTMKGLLLEIVIQENKIKKIIPREITINESFQPEIK